mmetsp:Transcript_27332/g.73910  ORF Transcript_27332/g.73910 Transcript_27332/m.73910 type:complete len:436 (-) Transcript_27332:858-2165(-)
MGAVRRPPCCLKFEVLPSLLLLPPVCLLLCLALLLRCLCSHHVAEVLAFVASAHLCQLLLVQCLESALVQPLHLLWRERDLHVSRGPRPPGHRRDHAPLLLLPRQDIHMVCAQQGAGRQGGLLLLQHLVQLRLLGFMALTQLDADIWGLDARRQRGGDARVAGGHARLDASGDAVRQRFRVLLLLLFTLFLFALLLLSLKLAPVLSLCNLIIALCLPYMLPEHISIDGVALLIHRRLAPATWVVPKLGTWRNGGIQAGDAQVGVGGRRTITLHVDKPGRGGVLTHAQGLSQVFAQDSGLGILHARLKLLALVVHLPDLRQLGLGLVLKEGVMQHLVVNVHLAHLGLHPCALFGLQRLGALLLRVPLTHLPNACSLYEVWQLEGRLLDTPLALQVLAFLGPVTRHRCCVSVGLQVNQHLRVGRGHVPHFHHVRPLC